MTRWSARSRPRCPSKTPCSASPTAWRRRSGRRRDAGPRVAARFLSEARACFEANAPILERLAGATVSASCPTSMAIFRPCAIMRDVRRYFGVIVDSARVGFSKPDPRISLPRSRRWASSLVAPSWWAIRWPGTWRGRERRGMAHIWLAPIRRARDGRAARETRDPVAGCEWRNCCRDVGTRAVGRHHRGGRRQPPERRRARTCPSPWCRWPACR